MKKVASLMLLIPLLFIVTDGGEREFHWSSCDESPAGVKFTKIAEYIITQSEMKE